jgi:cytochrome P450
LRDATEKSPIQNMREWYNWTTFDIIGDLSFGVDGGFGCLETSSYHPWIDLITISIKQLGQLSSLVHIGLQQPIVWISKSGVLADSKHRAIVAEKVAQRMEGSERPDFLEGLIRKKDELTLTPERMAANAALLIVAGSETTATLLSGATYLLTKNPDTLRKLEQEVRSAFKSDEEITFQSVGHLSYVSAQSIH